MDMEKYTLYKYKDISSDSGFKWAIDSLKQKYFYFARPSQLNDPFDCQFPACLEPTSDKDILEYVKRANKIISGKNILTVAKMKNYLKTQRDNGYVDFDVAYKKRLEAMSNALHICSLTPFCDNEMMWALYASQYKGICIGYKALKKDEKYFYVEVNRQSNDIDKLITEINSNYYFPFTKIQYDNDGSRKLNVFTPDMDIFEHYIFHKKPHWQNEHEYRATYMEEYNETKNKKEICVYYPDDTLASITFGYRCDINKKEKIIRTIKRNYPNFSNIIFYDAKPDYVTAKIERVKIPI